MGCWVLDGGCSSESVGVDVSVRASVRVSVSAGVMGCRSGDKVR